MKRIGTRSEYIDERMQDLMKTYRKNVEECSHLDFKTIYSHVVNTPTYRFWISDEAAVQTISYMLKNNGDLSLVTPNKREMIIELYHRVKEFLKVHPNESLDEAVFVCIRTPAPKYYITPGTAHVLIHKYQKAWREKRKQKHLL